MMLSVRNWLWESGVGVSYSGTSFPSNSVLLSGNTANLWKASTAGIVGFTLGATRAVDCVGLFFVTSSAATTQTITARVRSGGSGGSVVATYYLSVVAYTLGELVQRSSSSFLESAVGDYVEFDLTALTLPVHAFGFWAGAALTFPCVDFDFSYVDTSDIQQAASGVLHANRNRIRRDVVVTIPKLVETLSIGAKARGSSFEDLEDALTWAGMFPTVLADLSESDLEETIAGRLTMPGRLEHATGPDFRGVLRLTDY